MSAARNALFPRARCAAEGGGENMQGPSAARAPRWRHIGVAQAELGRCNENSRCFMHGPIVGELMAELVLTKKTHIDISGFALQRFSIEELHSERNFASALRSFRSRCARLVTSTAIPMTPQILPAESGSGSTCA